MLFSQRNRMEKRRLRDTSDPLTLPETIFKQLYRLRRDSARFLINLIIPFLPQRVREEISLPDNLIVLCALHFFSQGSYQKSVGQDLVMPMSQSSVSNCINAITDILNDNFGHLIKFPTTEAEKNEQKRKFMEMPNGFPGIIGAIDCTHIKIHAPKFDDEEAPAILFYNRKGFYSLNVQCIVGADLKLLALNAKYPGSVHDSAIWSTSQIRTYLLTNYQNGERNSWLIGDGGYPLEPWLMVPVGGRDLDLRESRYNVAHRSNRNVVERFNGVFKAIFRCCSGERTLHYSPEKSGKIINACGILHNIRIERRDFEEREVNQDNNYDHQQQHPHNQQQHPHNQWLNDGRRVRQQLINNYF